MRLMGTRLFRVIARWFGYEVESEQVCNFCGAVCSDENAVRHISIFHPEEAARLKPEWEAAGEWPPKEPR